MITKKMGRPKSDNSRKTQLGVRLTDEELQRLDEVSAHYSEKRAETIRRGINSLYDELKK